LNSRDHKEFNELSLVPNGSINFEFSNVRYFRFNKQTFIDSGKINKKFDFLYILRTLNAHISMRKAYGDEIPKIFIIKSGMRNLLRPVSSKSEKGKLIVFLVRLK
jgi:hypothetical protein